METTTALAPATTDTAEAQHARRVRMAENIFFLYSLDRAQRRDYIATWRREGYPEETLEACCKVFKIDYVAPQPEVIPA